MALSTIKVVRSQNTGVRIRPLSPWERVRVRADSSLLAPMKRFEQPVNELEELI